MKHFSLFYDFISGVRRSLTGDSQNTFYNLYMKIIEDCTRQLDMCSHSHKSFAFTVHTRSADQTTYLNTANDIVARPAGVRLSQENLK